MKKFINHLASYKFSKNLTKALFISFEKFGGLIGIFKLHAFIPHAHKSSVCRYDVWIKYGENIFIGENSRIGPKCILGAKSPIIIGENVVISSGVHIETAGLDRTIGPPFNSHTSKPIVIENNCWIGSSTLILGGVTIGEGSIIGAGVIITKNVKPNSIIVGSPSRVLN